MTKVLPKNLWPALPKWPGVFITGQSVSPEQAKDIIFRTDISATTVSKYISGNNSAFKKHCIKSFGWKPLVDIKDLLYSSNPTDKAKVDRFTEIMDKNGFSSIHEIYSLWQQEMGVVETNYVYNCYLSSSYIGGPTGWVQPDGKILFEGHNYGKWPSVEEIVEDWTNLVNAFPYLDLVCTLFDDEACCENAKPVCTIVVKNSVVDVYEPDLNMHQCQFFPPKFDQVFGDFLSRDRCENAWPESWIDEFSKKSTMVMKKIAPFAFKYKYLSAVATACGKTFEKGD